MEKQWTGKHRGLWTNGQTKRTMEKPWTNIGDYGETMDKHRGLRRNDEQTNPEMRTFDFKRLVQSPEIEAVVAKHAKDPSPTDAPEDPFGDVMAQLAIASVLSPVSWCRSL